MSRAMMDLQVEVQNLQEMALKIEQHIKSKESLIRNKEERLAKGLTQPSALRDLEVKTKKQLPSWLAPGNVGDLNQVVWPFMFVAEALQPMAPNSNIRASFSNTQDSSFVCTHFVKSVYLYDSGNDYMTYLNPDNVQNAQALAPGLQFSIRDSVSQREFFGRPADLAEYGNPRFPTRLPAPQFIIPRGTWEVNFYNNNPTLFLYSVDYVFRIQNAR